MDVGRYHERQCLRVAVPERGECNPAGKPNAGFGLDCEAAEPDVAKETSTRRQKQTTVQS